MARKLIVEADGASRGNPGPASYGALVADAETGEVLVELAEPIGVTTNNVAEYRGLIAGLRAAYAIDPEAEVEARMDSKLAVQQMSGAWQIKHPSIRPLAVEARGAFPRAGRVKYTWVPRERNRRADALGNLALDAPEKAAAKMAAAAEVMARGRGRVTVSQDADLRPVTRRGGCGCRLMMRCSLRMVNPPLRLLLSRSWRLSPSLSSPLSQSWRSSPLRLPPLAGPNRTSARRPPSSSSATVPPP